MLVVKGRRKNPTLVAAPTSSGKRIMRTLVDAMEKIRGQVSRQEPALLDAVMHLPLDRVADLVPVQPWFDAQAVIEDELFREVLDGGSRVTLPSIQKAAIDFAFDRSRPEAAEWARKEGAQLVTNVVEDQRAIIRSYVGRSMEDGIAPRDVARGLRNVVGLTEAQEGWVANHYDRQYAQAVSRGLTPARAADVAQRSTDRYHSQVFRYRTETIARTEILRASHEGRREAWAQGRREGFIPATAKKQWSTAIDDRTCDICGPLNEFTVPIDANFPDGEPPIHPMCRCDVILLDRADPDLASLSDAELDAQIETLLGGGDPELVAPGTQAARWGAPEDTVARNLTRRQGERFSDGNYTVIDEWVSGDYVIDVQESLRFAGGRLDDVSPDVKRKVLDLADRSVRLEDDVTLYRVVPRDALPDDLVVDAMVWDDAFATTVVRKADYEEFLSYGGPLGGGDSTFTIEIRAAAGTEGVWASPAGITTDVASFEEFILMPGQRMKILEVLADKIVVGIGV